jgi:endonuclease/exonuclease/phosphatase family metal-dependent hydrolase
MASFHVLTYNICWQAMSNTAAGSTPLLGEMCIKNADGTTLCMRNLIDFIEAHDHIKFDIIGLQESNKYKTIIKHSNTLKKLNYVVHRSGPEDIITFYNHSFKLEALYVGEFNSGRPFQILVFDQVVVVNLHFNHSQSVDLLENVLSNGFNKLHKADSDIKLKLEEQVIIYESMISNTRPLVLLGDFNMKYYKKVFKCEPFKKSKAAKEYIKTQSQPNPKPKPLVVSTESLVKACCSDKSSPDKFNYELSGDFVLSNCPPTINKIPEGYDYSSLISDHLPVMAVISK